MQILNLTPTLMERGKIKIGKKGEERTSQKGKKFQLPEKLDHFLITTVERDRTGNFLVDETMMRKYAPNGEKVRTIPIRLLYDDIDLNFRSWYACYRGNKCWCFGDGIGAQRLKAADSIERDKVPCPCGKYDFNYEGQDKCKPNGVLQVLLRGAERIGGVWVFRTTSWNTVSSILASLKMIKALSNGILAGIPLNMVLTPKMVTAPNGSTQTVYIVSLEFEGSEDELPKLGFEIARQRHEYRIRMDRVEEEARATLGLPSPASESPEDIRAVREEFYPEGVMIEMGCCPRCGEKMDQDEDSFFCPPCNVRVQRIKAEPEDGAGEPALTAVVLNADSSTTPIAPGPADPTVGAEDSDPPKTVEGLKAADPAQPYKCPVCGYEMPEKLECPNCHGKKKEGGLF